MGRKIPHAASPFPQNRMPSEAYRLVLFYQIGSPIKVYKDMESFFLTTFTGLIFVVVAIFFLITNFHIQGTQSSLNDSHVSELLLALSLLVVGVLLIIFSFKLLVRRSIIYEGTEGFVELEGKETAIISVRWDQIFMLWHRVAVVLGGYHSKVIMIHTYLLLTEDGRQYKIRNTQLRKRIEQKLVSHSLPNVIARYHAGELISFGEIIMNKYRVNLGAYWYSWEEISPIFQYSGENIVFFFKNSSKNITIPISLVPNICVLEALLKYIQD